MARIKKPLSLEELKELRELCKTNGFCLYELEGEYIMRAKGEVDKSQYRHSPSFKKMRESMSEFGGSAMIGKALRNAIGSYAATLGDRYITSRLGGVIRKMLTNGPGTTGRRKFELIKQKEILTGFEFNGDKSFKSVFDGPFTFVGSSDRKSVTLTVPSFNTKKLAELPKGATHFRLVNAIAVLTGYNFKTETQQYEPEIPGINGTSALAISGEIPLSGMIDEPLALSACIEGVKTIPDGAGVIACIGIEFLQEVNGEFHSFKGENVMKIVAVF